MAGIGFELKKLFGSKLISSKIAGVFHSVFSTIGQMLIVVVLLVVINIFMYSNRIEGEFKELYSSAVLYAFVFSLIFTSGINMVLSRYLADTIYVKQFEKILPSMYGSLTTVLFVCGILGGIFYFLSPLEGFFKLGGYLLFIEMCAVFLLMTYVSALKKYSHISIAFLIGMTITGILSVMTILYIPISLKMSTYLVYSMVIGIFVTICLVVRSIKLHFNKTSGNYFEFLKYFEKFKNLFFANTFYALGLYIHNFVYWAFPQTQYSLGNTYIYSPSYDMASFLAILTVLSANVLFVVRMETSFYDTYKKYLHTINNGTYENIQTAKKEMTLSVWQEFVYVIEIQVIISIALIAITISFMQNINLTSMTMEIFPFLACGYYFSFMMFIVTTLLMYF